MQFHEGHLDHSEYFSVFLKWEKCNKETFIKYFMQKGQRFHDFNKFIDVISSLFARETQYLFR